jgi:DNA-directed RNA polymerase specialized sigma24 family protein
VDRDHHADGVAGAARADRGPVTASPEGDVPSPADSPEFEDLFRSEFPRLTAIALSTPGITFDEARDAAESALGEVARRWGELGNPQGYAYKATISHLMRIKNNRRRQDQIVRRHVITGAARPEALEDPAIAAVEFRDWVKSILGQLPPAQREAAACCLIDEMSPAEAGVLLGKTGAALRQALRAARLTLQHLLAEQDAGEPVITSTTSTSMSTRSVPAAAAGRREVR